MNPLKSLSYSNDNHFEIFYFEIQIHFRIRYKTNKINIKIRSCKNSGFYLTRLNIFKYIRVHPKSDIQTWFLYFRVHPKSDNKIVISKLEWDPINHHINLIIWISYTACIQWWLNNNLTSKQPKCTTTANHKGDVWSEYHPKTRVGF